MENEKFSKNNNKMEVDFIVTNAYPVEPSAPIIPIALPPYEEAMKNETNSTFLRLSGWTSSMIEDFRMNMRYYI